MGLTYDDEDLQREYERFLIEKAEAEFEPGPFVGYNPVVEYGYDSNWNGER